MSVIEMKNVSFAPSKSTIIKNANIEINEGTITEIYGPSGSGKSVIIKMLAGIIEPTSGNVLYNGKDLKSLTYHEELAFRHNCASVFQNSALWSNQTIGQNIMLPLQIHYPKMKLAERNEHIQEVCRRIDYTKSLNARPSDISDGEQKKIALARALIINPKLLLLDECTLSLDDRSSEIVIDLLHDYVNAGNTIVYISHNQKFRWEFPGYLYEIKNGTPKLQEIDIEDLR